MLRGHRCFEEGQVGLHWEQAPIDAQFQRITDDTWDDRSTEDSELSSAAAAFSATRIPQEIEQLARTELSAAPARGIEPAQADMTGQAPRDIAARHALTSSETGSQEMVPKRRRHDEDNQ